MKKMQPAKQRFSIILLVFLLISIELLKVVSIYCYLIKYTSKQKLLIPYYVTNDKLKKLY